MKMTSDEIIDQFGLMTIDELMTFVREFKEKFGVEFQANYAQPIIFEPNYNDVPDPEVQTEFSVLLAGIGSEKIKVIKAVREITSLGLKESKELVDNAPSTILESVSSDRASNAREKLESVGAKVEVS